MMQRKNYWLCCVLVLLWMPTCIKSADAGVVHWDKQTRQITLLDNTGEVLVEQGFASVELIGGERIRSDNQRFVVSISADESKTTVSFTDTKQQIDMRLVVMPRGRYAVSLSLHITNRSDKTFSLDRIKVLNAQLAGRHESGKRHLLCNGFILSESHPTFREEGTTNVSSRETIALESPPLAAGWLTGKHNFGCIDLKNLNSCPKLIAHGCCDGCALLAGASRDSDLFFLSTAPHPLAEMERFATLAGEINKVKIWPPRIAWCTWYAGWQRKQMAKYKDGMERGIEQTIPEIKKYFASRGAKTIRICDDFIDYGDWSNQTITLPGGFARLSRLITEAGLTPGVWYAPYWANADAKVLREHPEWFARDKQGKIWFETGWQPKSRNTTAFAVFDTSHPEVIDYFEKTARRWREYGFRYVSTDFLGWAIKPDQYHDPTMTKAEILHAGLAAIRRGLGPNIFYRPINNPLGVAMGIANDTRISGDSHGDNPTAYTRAAEVWFYNRRVWLNDPSAIVCARYGKLRDINWNRLWMSWMALAGTVLTYGEVIDELPEKYIEMYQRIFPNLPVAGRPLDIWENSPYMLWGMDPYQEKKEQYKGQGILFGIFDVKGNDGKSKVQLNLDEISVRCRSWDKKPEEAPESYLLWDFWRQKLLQSEKEKLILARPSKSCYLFALRPKLNRPQLLGTSGHFSQGAVEVPHIAWDATTATLTGKVLGNGGDPTSLFFYLPEGMKIDRASLADQGVEVRYHQPRVLAMDVPALSEPTAFKLVFAGQAEPESQVKIRPFVTGRSATVLTDNKITSFQPTIKGLK